MIRAVQSAGIAVILVFLSVTASVGQAGEITEAFTKARENGMTADRTLAGVHKMLKAWLSKADPETLLLPDAVPDCGRKDSRIDWYTPHNSAADNYPYLVASAYFTDRPLFYGRMIDMLRNEILRTNVSGAVPGNFNLKDRTLGPKSIFGAAEYAKDGLIAITELLGRTPWFYRMVDMTVSTMEQAPTPSRFGLLPDPGAEVNGDMLQVLVRLATMTGDKRFQEWAERIADVYVDDILPKCYGLPCYSYDFATGKGEDRVRLRDHGNEMVVGLVLLYALESYQGTERAARYRPVVARMLDRILESANPDGLLYDEIRCSDLKPLQTRLSDNWGYVYGAVYTFYMVTGEQKYRDAVIRVLKNLPKYRNHDWEKGSQDGYADAIESALYLISREPVPEAVDWVESEIKVLQAYQRPDGLIECWYGDGNWARTNLLYALWKSQGCFVEGWREGVRVGAEKQGQQLYVSLECPAGWTGRLRFDYARHKREMNFDRNYVRLNEWPEWFTVDENAIYQIKDQASGARQVRLGSELKQGIPVSGSLQWILRPLARP